MAKRRKKDFVREEIEEVEAVVGREREVDNRDFLDKYRNILLGLLFGIVLLLAAYIIYKNMILEPKEKEAKAAIYKAEQQFERDSFKLALFNPGGGFDGLIDIIDSYSGTKTANLAKLYAGISHLNIGNYDEAIDQLQSHSASGDLSPILKNGNIGDAYSEKNEFEQAISYYEKATNASEDALLTPYYLYKLGLLAKRTGNNAKALSAFQRIKDKYKDSNEGSNIDVLIKSVNS